MVDRFRKGTFVNVLTICEYFSFELKDFFLAASRCSIIFLGIW